MDRVVGIFDRYSNADLAVRVLNGYGMDGKTIRMVTRDEEDVVEIGTPTASIGAITGAATGGLIGLLAGMRAVFVPVGGPLDPAGLLVSTLLVTLGVTAIGAVVGAVMGGLLAALIKSGFHLKEADDTMKGMKRGQVLVSVETEPVLDSQVSEILRDAGAVDMNIVHE